MRTTTIARSLRAALTAALALALAWSVAACDEASAPKEQLPPTLTPMADGGGRPTSDAGPGGDGGTPLDCVVEPKTHEEILRRCSDSEKVDKQPVLPLLLPDGGLPPLPQ